ncbi:hypothetical protein [Glycomyces xiaoerkulensis]|uniref:hypothetical protein n=1 Tax=Glycomyces xiaoerkulensis TaxID=2038139 RepID=UPI000C25E5F2|nr:hypothetical protein [Glycomyces xiaoerkulensis]
MNNLQIKSGWRPSDKALVKIRTSLDALDEKTAEMRTEASGHDELDAAVFDLALAYEAINDSIRRQLEAEDWRGLIKAALAARCQLRGGEVTLQTEEVADAIWAPADLIANQTPETSSKSTSEP